MISVREVAESLTSCRASVGDINTLSECIMESLVSLGASPNADMDFGGPRRKKVYTLDEAAHQLAERYLGEIPPPSVGETDVIKEGIERGLKKIGCT